MEIRSFLPDEEAVFINLCKEFYSSEAVLHPVPESYFFATFSEMMKSDRYVEGFLFLDGGETAGYGLIAKSFSNEVGGQVIWVEEIYLRPAFRSKGFGSAFFAFLEQRFPDARRFRLEIEPDNVRAKALYQRKGYRLLPYAQMVKEATEDLK